MYGSMPAVAPIRLKKAIWANRLYGFFLICSWLIVQKEARRYKKHWIVLGFLFLKRYVLAIFIWDFHNYPSLVLLTVKIGFQVSTIFVFYFLSCYRENNTSVGLSIADRVCLPLLWICTWSCIRLWTASPQYVVVADDMWYFGSVSGFRTAAPVFMVHDSYLGVFFSGCVRKRIQPALFWFQAKSGRPLYHTCEYVSAGSL